MSLFRDLLIEKKRKPYYCEVEYLEGTGTQYIDTGLDYFADFEIGIQLRNSVSNKALGNGAFYCLQRYNATNPYWQFTSGQGSGKFYNTTVPITEHHIMKWKDNKTYSDNTFITNLTKDLNESNRMYLFSANGTTIYPNMIYFCKLWEPNSGLLVRDLIPVLDFSLKPCMYDRVSGKLFYNAGTGDFLYGREIHYVDYLESTETQYIDLGLYGNLNTEIEVRAYVPEHTAHFALVGDFTDSTKAITLPVNYGTSGLYSRFGNKSITTGLGTNEGTYKFVINKTGYYRDDVLLDSFSTTTSFTTSSTLMLFGFTNLGRNYYAGKVYYCKVYDNGVIVGDFIPAIDENDTFYMFDKVTHTVYTNVGTGSFIGPTVEKDGNGKVIESRWF